jgi:lipopolysaccharide/colanic/teichoic acid biosynthesis glycosyltransferase
MGSDQSDISAAEAAATVKALPVWKRLLDLAFVAAVSPLLLLLGAALALIVKCGSRGPILFRQTRIGLHGRPFTLFKFRTMRVDAETQSHQHHTEQLMNSNKPMTKLDAHQDPRLVPLGAALRALGLDELPQFLNVLRGEMSVVGPRPCVPYEYERYTARHRVRLNVLPGLTGLWQVSGKNRTTFQQMIELDIDYSRRLSLWTDLKIIFKTIPALLIQCWETRAARRNRSAAVAAEVTKSAPIT